MDHGAPDAAAAVVLAELDRVVAADNALLRPVELVRARLVAHPVLVGVPERASLEDDHPPSLPRQPLGEHRAAGAGADDAEVDLVVVAVAAHRLLAGEVAAVDVEQEARVVRRGADRTLEHPLEHGPHALPLPHDRHGILVGRARPLEGLADAERPQPHESPRIGGAAEADLVPCPGMRVEGGEHGAHAHRPGAL